MLQFIECDASHRIESASGAKLSTHHAMLSLPQIATVNCSRHENLFLLLLGQEECFWHEVVNVDKSNYRERAEHKENPHWFHRAS